MATTSKEEIISTVELEVVEVEQESVIVMVDGWRIRVRFDKLLPKKDAESIYRGKVITASYKGDRKDVHSLKFLPLKKI